MSEGEESPVCRCPWLILWEIDEGSGVAVGELPKPSCNVLQTCHRVLIASRGGGCWRITDQQMCSFVNGNAFNVFRLNADPADSKRPAAGNRFDGM